MVISPELYDFIIKIVEDKVKDIKVTKVSFDRLSNKVERLEEAQEKTESAVKELNESQKNTEIILKELAEAQKNTEVSIKELTEIQKNTGSLLNQLAQTVGRLSDNIGYGLEDIAKVVLPGVLEKYKKINVTEFQRKIININSEEYEIDLYGEGVSDQTEIILIGDCKSRIYYREVKDFLEKVSVLEEVIQKPIFKFMFGFYIHPSAQTLADSSDIYLVDSYMK